MIPLILIPSLQMKRYQMSFCMIINCNSQRKWKKSSFSYSFIWLSKQTWEDKCFSFRFLKRTTNLCTIKANLRSSTIPILKVWNIKWYEMKQCGCGWTQHKARIKTNTISQFWFCENALWVKLKGYSQIQEWSLHACHQLSRCPSKSLNPKF